MSTTTKVSLIITTYNWPSALNKVLEAVAAQSYSHFEVIIADDGSGQETVDVIEAAKKKYPFPLHHVWQPDQGSQAAKIRNKAIASAHGDYLILMDGDCIPLPSFISRHVQLAEPGWLVAGNRILLKQNFTLWMFENNISLHKKKLFHLLLWWLSKKFNRFFPLVYFPFLPRKLRAMKWQGAKTCNLGLWKKDFIKVNGFDESFVGWGHEDSDLINRLIKSGIKRKEGRCALPVFHCWHKEQNRSLQKENWARFTSRLADDTILSALGIDQYLSEKVN